MDRDLSSLRAALAETQKAQESLDRKVFHLKALLETSRELSGIIQPQKVMDTFLLMAMGQLGVGRGMAVLINEGTMEGAVSSRGFPAAEAARLDRLIPQIHESYFSQQDPDTPAAAEPRVITREGLADHSLFPPRTDVLTLWRVDRVFCGLLGLGAKVSGEPIDTEDMDILLNLANILISALRHTLTSTNINRLNAELHKKNDQLEQALAKARQAQRELDRRVFHLKALNDLTDELGPIIHAQALLDNFLLTAQGVFSARQAVVLLVDRQSRSAQMSSRGAARIGETSFEAADRLLYHCFELSEFRQIAPMSVSLIHEPGDAFELAGFGFEADLACFFVIDQTQLGLVALGPSITGEPYAREETQLLALFCGSFMVFLKNALAFETIEALNQDLTRRNEELRRTISDLTEARQTIDLLERAKERLKAMVMTAGERAGRARPLDFAFILGLAAILGLLFNFSSPTGIPLVQPVLFAAEPPGEEAPLAFAKVAAGRAVILDARPREFYEQKRIKGALNAPPALFDVVYLMNLARLPLDTEIIVYGRSISRRYDQETAQRLAQKDFENVTLLRGGLDAWEAAGLPVEQR